MTTSSDNHHIARLYRRIFSYEEDIREFRKAVGWIKDRITAATMTYHLYQNADEPLILYELWTYPDEETMQWVQSSMENAAVIPRKFTLETVSETLTLIDGFSKSVDDD